MKVSDKYLRDLLREVVKARAHGHCEYPGCNTTECDPHHHVSKDNAAARYNPDACIYLCAFHHTSGSISAHGTPYIFDQQILWYLVRSPEWFEELNKIRSTIVKNDDYFRQLWKKILMEMLCD